MKPFIHDDFLLHTETAKILYHKCAEPMPIIDFHNHLNPKEIYEDCCYDNLTGIWLGGDHYKWRAMRANGIAEDLITGTGKPYDKFLAWADTVQNCLGNPLYHWTHLELKRYFDINQTLTPSTAPEIWRICNTKLQTKDYSVRNLLKMQNVRVLCTTDDPADDLRWHKKLKEDGFEIQVLPTFRPEKALAVEKNEFTEYIELLGSVTGFSLTSLDLLIQALIKRLDYFVTYGCRVTDHSLESDFYAPGSYAEANAAFQKRITGSPLTLQEQAIYRGYILTALGKEYAKRNLVMQLHIGAMRNNSIRMLHQIGSDSGFDSSNDFNYAPQLSALMNEMDKTDELPKIILYYLNPKDADMLSVMAGNFQGNNSGIRGKIQLGSAWWHCDHKNGMERQIDALADTGLLSTFVGMLTDSRSFLSFSRHEYFRRILCNKIGKLVEDGEYPTDWDYLGKMIQNICCCNAEVYFNFQAH